VTALEADPDDIPLIKLAAGALEEEAPEFQPAEEERRRVTALLGEAFGGFPARPLVLLNPNASDMLPLRKWETGRFVELGKRLLAADDRMGIVVTGAPSEAESAREVAMLLASDRVVCLAGKTSLRELLVLYGLADVLVTNDSGPGHFASMTNIQSIVLFGPETPALFGPMGGRGKTLYANLACSPCVNVFNHRFSPCRNNRCMQAISVEEVFHAVQSCLSGRVS
jgi:ADP-heptose:LPS heptosyltransferase